MTYFIGIDGGGSKTRGLLADDQGLILSDLTLSGSNHQTLGHDQTQNILNALIQALLKSANIDSSQLTHVELALSGADLPPDFEILNRITSEILPATSFEVVNDSWGLLRSGLKQNWGAVSIYGTGSNAGVITPSGERFILRALTYPLGGYGGGHDLAVEALHYMFRADEKTYKPTLLTSRLPELLGYKSPDDMVPALFPEDLLTREDYNQIPPLVFALAQENDEVCLEILYRLGKTQGQMVAGVIRQSKTESLPVPVVIGGSVYQGTHPALIQAMLEEIQRTAPEAYLVTSHYPPALGALLLAYEHSQIEVSEHHYDVFDAYFKTK